jgi:hypothetical protein
MSGVALAVLLVGGVGAVPASADDPPPILPPGVTPPTVAPTHKAPSGPTYVITPGVGGSDLPAPGDQKAVDDAKKTDLRSDHRSGAKPESTKPRNGRAGAAVTGPQTPLGSVSDSPSPVGLLWKGVAATVMMLVLFEITVVRRYLLRRRRAAVTAG